MPERTPLNARSVARSIGPPIGWRKSSTKAAPTSTSQQTCMCLEMPPSRCRACCFRWATIGAERRTTVISDAARAWSQLGYLVLAFDPMGQGERIYYPDSTKKHSRLSSPDAEHTVPGKQMLLYGDTTTRLQLWDAIRSLDFLAAHPLVDPKRLASTGHSGGGTLTMLLAAADDRLAAAAVCMGNLENVACRPFQCAGLHR